MLASRLVSGVPLRLPPAVQMYLSKRQAKRMLRTKWLLWRTPIPLHRSLFLRLHLRELATAMGSQVARQRSCSTKAAVLELVTCSARVFGACGATWIRETPPALEP